MKKPNPKAAQRQSRRDVSRMRRNVARKNEALQGAPRVRHEEKKPAPSLGDALAVGAGMMAVAGQVVEAVVKKPRRRKAATAETAA